MPSKTGRSYGQKDADNTLIYAYSQKLIPEFAGLLIDSDGNILFCSENAKELCSYRSNGSLINLVFAEDRDVLKRCLEARSDCCIRLHFRKKACSAVSYSGNGIFTAYIFVAFERIDGDIAAELKRISMSLDYIKTFAQKHDVTFVAEITDAFTTCAQKLEEYNSLYNDARRNHDGVVTDMGDFIKAYIDFLKKGGYLEPNSTECICVGEDAYSCIDPKIFTRFVSACVYYIYNQSENAKIKFRVKGSHSTDGKVRVTLSAQRSAEPDYGTFVNFLSDVSAFLGWETELSKDPEFGSVSLIITLPSADAPKQGEFRNSGRFGFEFDFEPYCAMFLSSL